MTCKNLTLITLNNTLHIKADNLEPVEVDSSCIDNLIDDVWFEKRKTRLINEIPNAINLMEGINISELSDRIEVRNCTKYINTESYSVPVVCKRAFLLPVKEWADTKDFTWKDATEEEIQSEALPSLTEKYGKSFEKSYTIEEIKNAISIFVAGEQTLDTDPFEVIINNLKK